MIPTLRHALNQTITPDTYRAMLADLNADLPGLLDFRVAETPVFVPKTLTERLLLACDEVIGGLTRPDFVARTEAAIPAHQRVPHESAHPNFLAIDFAICRDHTGGLADGELVPQLIELQGFPSLFAFQPYLADLYRRHYPAIPDTVSHLFDDADNAAYLDRLRDIIVGDEDPATVILLDLYPEKQKTRLDFALTRRYLGVEAVCLTKIKKNGRALYYEKDGQRQPIRRIYNRLIFDELAQHPELKTEFALTDDVDVTWAGHPNWFFRMSKFALPLLDSVTSAYIPESNYLSDLTAYPADLENYVLKPLFSFAGAGVRLVVTPADLDAIPNEQRSGYLLQRKVVYEPVVESPTGLVKCEIRLLLGWPDGDGSGQPSHPRLLTNLARLSRGAMIGVDFNKDFDWVGGSIGLFER
jgi:hypothetical protein